MNMKFMIEENVLYVQYIMHCSKLFKLINDKSIEKHTELSTYTVFGDFKKFHKWEETML